MRAGFMVVTMLTLLFGGIPSGAPSMSAEQNPSFMVDTEQAQALLQAGALVLDVRTPAEFAAGHLPKAANLDIRDPQFEAKVARLDRAATYLVYCRTQNRSQAAAAVMQRLGFANVKVLRGGVVEWARRGLPSEPAPPR